MVIHDQYDHRMILGADDPLLAAMQGLPGLVVLPIQPTAENLAQLAFEQLQELLAPLSIEYVEVQETTSCVARYSK